MLSTKKDTVLLVFIILKSVLASDVCTTRECRKSSTDILSFINSSIDPCEDFYKFTCSGIFKKTHEAKPASLREILRKELDEQTSMMLIKPIDSSEPKPIQGLKKLFRACMDEAAIEKYGYSSLERALKLLGGWPVVEGSNWNEQEFNVEELLVKLRRMGFSFAQFFDMATTMNGEGATFVVSEPTVKPVDDEDKKNFHVYMVNMAILLGADKERAYSEMQEALTFKAKLLNILENQGGFNKTSIKTISEHFKFINWYRFINNIIYPNEAVSEDFVIYFSSTNYFKNLETLLSITPSRTVANFIIWETLDSIQPYLPKGFREFETQYMRLSKNPTSEDNKLRLRFCINKAKETLRPVFEILYIREYFTEEKKQKVCELVSSVKTELIRFLNETDIYDDDTRKRMLEKAKDVTYTIGGPDIVFDKYFLMEIFDEKESINTNDFLTIASTLNRQSTNIKFKLNSAMVIQNSDYEDTISDNIYYSTLYNNIVLPAGVLHSLYFNANRPRYLNFGTIGRILASELFHGFTFDGSNYNNGPYRAELWTDFTKKHYQELSACMIEAIENYEIENSYHRMNGEKVLDETVCDYAGVSLAYKAYESWISKYEEEKQLPGLNYTPKQLFWISLGTTFCDTIDLDKIREFVENEEVAYPNYRLLGALKNSKYFAHDFNCPSGSPMNPTEKCYIF